MQGQVVSDDGLGRGQKTPPDRATGFVALVVGMCVTLAAFTAMAGDDSDKKGEKGETQRSIDIEKMKAGAAERFAKLDANGDGKVTPEEFAAARMALGDSRGADRRWRGPGGREEMRKRMGKASRKGMRERRGAMGRQMRGMLSEQVFDAADGDGDGKLSKEEFGQLPQAARSVAQRRAFDRLDGDGDGALSVSELSPRVARLEKMDADGDGEIGREEMRAWRKEHASGEAKKERGWRKIRKSDDADADKTE